MERQIWKGQKQANNNLELCGQHCTHGNPEEVGGVHSAVDFLHDLPVIVGEMFQGGALPSQSETAENITQTEREAETKKERQGVREGEWLRFRSPPFSPGYHR